MDVKEWKSIFINDIVGKKSVRLSSSGTVYRIAYIINGEFHNISGPGEITWYKNGNKTQETFYINGIINNFILPNNVIPAHTIWHENGNKHYETYYTDNKLHNFIRTDGTIIPAHIAWFIDGTKMREEFWEHGEFKYRKYLQN